MKIKTKKNKYKMSLIILGAALLLCAAAVGAYLFVKSNDAAKKQQEALKSIDANKDGSEGKSTIPGDTTTKDDKNIIPSPPENSQSSNLEKPTLTRAEQSSENIRVSAIFTQPAYGTCEAVFSKEGYSTITKTASIILGPSYYTCNGFLIPMSEFPAKGPWIVKVIHRQDNRVVESDPQTINLQ
jgi:hypothetical protein